MNTDNICERDLFKSVVRVYVVVIDFTVTAPPPKVVLKSPLDERGSLVDTHSIFKENHCLWDLLSLVVKFFLPPLRLGFALLLDEFDHIGRHLPI